LRLRCDNALPAMLFTVEDLLLLKAFPALLATFLLVRANRFILNFSLKMGDNQSCHVDEYEEIAGSPL